VGRVADVQGISATVDEAPARAKPPTTRRSSGAAWAFAGVELLAVPLLLAWGGRMWFFVDDWDFLSQRSIGNIGDLFRPHYQHWVTLPVIAYRFLWWVFGLHSYAAYQLLVVVAHLAAAALLRVVMRRAGVGPWLATGFAVVFVFFGSGAENILVAFQVTFVGALAFGLAHLVLSDHDGPLDRRDWFGLAAGFAGLLCSGVALTMIGVVGLAALVRRGWRIALVHTVPLGVAYLVWTLAAPAGQPTADYRAHSVWEIVRFTSIGIQAMLGGFSGVRGLGIITAPLLVVGLSMFVARNGRTVLRGKCTATFALLVGAVAFLVVTAVFRAGQGGFLRFFVATGAERARQSRYVYLVAAMALPALALAAQTLIHAWRRAALVVALLLGVALVGNVVRLHSFTEVHSSRALVLTAPRLPIARQLPRTAEPTPGLQIGWLLDQLPSGRIPPPPDQSPTALATYALEFGLERTPRPVNTPCTTLREPVYRELSAGQSLTLKDGGALVTYVPLDGASSVPLPVPADKTVTALVPLRVAIAPALDKVVVCG
jgi:hypothetical protein